MGKDHCLFDDKKWEGNKRRVNQNYRRVGGNLFFTTKDTKSTKVKTKMFCFFFVNFVLFVVSFVLKVITKGAKRWEGQ